MNIKKLHLVKILLIILVLNILFIAIFLYRDNSDTIASSYYETDTIQVVKQAEKLKVLSYFGDPIAQLYLGDMYAFGSLYDSGKKQIGCCDREKAFYWYHRANNTLSYYGVDGMTFLRFSVVIVELKLFIEQHDEQHFDNAMWWLNDLAKTNSDAKHKVNSCVHYTNKNEFALCILNGNQYV